MPVRVQYPICLKDSVASQCYQTRQHRWNPWARYQALARLTDSKTQQWAAKASREYGVYIGKAHSSQHGEVNTYHVDVLCEVFDN